MEQKSKFYLDNDYHLTQNKIVDTEANLHNALQTEERNRKMKEEAKVMRNTDNSYKMINKNVDQEANLGGIVITEEEKIIENDEYSDGDHNEKFNEKDNRI